jgi:hypothetical protein
MFNVYMTRGMFFILVTPQYVNMLISRILVNLGPEACTKTLFRVTLCKLERISHIFFEPTHTF